MKISLQQQETITGSIYSPGGRNANWTKKFRCSPDGWIYEWRNRIESLMPSNIQL